MLDPSGEHQADGHVKQLQYRPLALQCGSEGRTAKHSTFRTWFVCWPDHCNPHWTILVWTFFSIAAYIVDVALDLTEVVKYNKSADYLWMSSILFYLALPCFISVIYFMIIQGRVWYEVYPVGMFYWSWKTVTSFRDIPPNEKTWTINDAMLHSNKLRHFLHCNRERTQASDLDVYFGAIPQLILQSYIIAAQTALHSHPYEVSYSSWLSLCSSAIFVLRYEPSARQGQKGVMVDMETVLEPALYDYIAENFFDFIYVIPRVVAVGCFLNIQPSYIPTLCFFVVHLTIAYTWFYLSAPKEGSEKEFHSRSSERDFRGTRRQRNDQIAHLQAAIASLVFPPTLKAWPSDFLDWKQRVRAVLTKQFCVVSAFQVCETCLLLGIWIAFAGNQRPVFYISIPVIVWMGGRVIFHVLYYAFLLFPIYTHEWEVCYRRRGLIAKAEIIRMSEELGGYFCPKIGPRLVKVHHLMYHPVRNREALERELEWLSNKFLSDSIGTIAVRRGRTQRHRLMAMGPQEKSLVKSTRRLALKSLEFLRTKGSTTNEIREEWKGLIITNHDIAKFWLEVLLAAMTHHYLPSRLHQIDRDLSLSVYPKMFHNLVIRNNFHSKRKRDQRMTIYTNNRRRSSTPNASTTMNATTPYASSTVLFAAGDVIEMQPRTRSSSFGEQYNFDYIESDAESGISYV